MKLHQSGLKEDKKVRRWFEDKKKTFLNTSTGDKLNLVLTLLDSKSFELNYSTGLNWSVTVEGRPQI